MLFMQPTQFKFGKRQLTFGAKSLLSLILTIALVTVSLKMCHYRSQYHQTRVYYKGN